MLKTFKFRQQGPRAQCQRYRCPSPHPGFTATLVAPAPGLSANFGHRSGTQEHPSSKATLPIERNPTQNNMQIHAAQQHEETKRCEIQQLCFAKTRSFSASSTSTSQRPGMQHSCAGSQPGHSVMCVISFAYLSTVLKTQSLYVFINTIWIGSRLPRTEGEAQFEAQLDSRCGDVSTSKLI